MKISILVGLLLFCVVVSALEHPFKRAGCTYHYEKDSASGPDHWSEVCADSDKCNHGTKQSPIDIITDGAFERETHALNASYQEFDNANFQNMGHTLQIFNTDTTVGLSGGPLTGFYNLVQAHFHAPSEHTWNGARYPLEMHLVHSFNAGAKLAVLGFFFEHSSTPNTFLQTFIEAVSEIPIAGNKTNINAHWELLLKSVGDYYHYSGSLTTPPCSEIVDWLFSENVLKATPEQVEALASKLDGNNRPIQPLHSRVLYQYKQSGSNSPSVPSGSNGANPNGNVINFNFANMFGNQPCNP